MEQAATAGEPAETIPQPREEVEPASRRNLAKQEVLLRPRPKPGQPRRVDPATGRPERPGTIHSGGLVLKPKRKNKRGKYSAERQQARIERGALRRRLRFAIDNLKKTIEADHLELAVRNQLEDEGLLESGNSDESLEKLQAFSRDFNRYLQQSNEAEAQAASTSSSAEVPATEDNKSPIEENKIPSENSEDSDSSSESSSVSVEAKQTPLDIWLATSRVPNPGFVKLNVRLSAKEETAGESAASVSGFPEAEQPQAGCPASSDDDDIEAGDSIPSPISGCPEVKIEQVAGRPALVVYSDSDIEETDIPFQAQSNSGGVALSVPVSPFSPTSSIDSADL